MGTCVYGDRRPCFGTGCRYRVRRFGGEVEVRCLRGGRHVSGDRAMDAFWWVKYSGASFLRQVIFSLRRGTCLYGRVLALWFRDLLFIANDDMTCLWLPVPSRGRIRTRGDFAPRTRRQLVCVTQEWVVSGRSWHPFVWCNTREYQIYEDLAREQDASS